MDFVETDIEYGVNVIPESTLIFTPEVTPEWARVSVDGELELFDIKLCQETAKQDSVAKLVLLVLEKYGIEI